MKFVILSIDGGGTRGIIPVQFLKLIEKETQIPIAQSFDLIAGTSTGGILACALSLGKKKHSIDPKYSLEQIEELYLNRSTEIFGTMKVPFTNWNVPFKGIRKFSKGFIGPRYSNKGINKVLNEYFENNRILDCICPILVTSYDTIIITRKIFQVAFHLHRIFQIQTIANKTIT
jgi:patatin-like phospholipase/acyl hydrolase